MRPFRSSILIFVLFLSASPPLLSQEPVFEKPPFAMIHTAYLERDEPTYTRLTRGALREARRLLPGVCIQRQKELVAVAKVRGFDGLEPLWLIYQDCAAQDRGTGLIQARMENLMALKGALRYAAGPAPQLPLRVSHWNSLFERGVRGEAARKVIEGYAKADPVKAQSWSLRSALSQASIKTGLCDIPPRLDQYGKIATAELLRMGQCMTGALGPADICEQLASGEAAGMSQANRDRLAELCDSMGAEAGAVGGGIDMLDGFSSDECAGESETFLFETEKIAQLVQDCYMSEGEGNPLALGPTDIGAVANQLIEWESGGTANAFITIGSGKEKDHYHGTGNTPEEARQRLEKKLSEASKGKDAEGNTILKNETREEKNADGTTSTVEETTKSSTEGSFITETNRTNSDGSSSSMRTEQNADGSSESSSVSVDADGNTTTTESQTDKDGNTTTTVVNRDKNGKVTGSGQMTSGPPESGDENGFDPLNPACQELATLGTMPGNNRAEFWDQLLERGGRVDPRKIYPNPESAGAEEEPLCGAPGIGNTNAPARCNTPVMCVEGTVLDDSCKCSSPLGGAIALRGCFAATCPPDTTPQPVGMNACICSRGEGPTEGLPPLPDVSRATLSFSELVWNRSDGMIFVTQEMAGGGEMPIEPPR